MRLTTFRYATGGQMLHCHAVTSGPDKHTKNSFAVQGGNEVGPPQESTFRALKFACGRCRGGQSGDRCGRCRREEQLFQQESTAGRTWGLIPVIPRSRFACSAALGAARTKRKGRPLAGLLLGPTRGSQDSSPATSMSDSGCSHAGHFVADSFPRGWCRNCGISREPPLPS